MTRELRVMLVDDEAPAREGLRLRLRREPGVTIVGEHASAASALEGLRDERPDVLFLDIQMPGVDGFALLERAEGRLPPAVIFVTAHERHAPQAFDVRALDYLLKPVEQERLRETLARAREHLERMEKVEIADRVRGLVAGLAPDDAPGSPTRGTAARIPVKKDGAIQFVDPDDIDYVDAAGDAVRLHVGSAEHLVSRSMGEMLALLDPSRFARIHRSTIVNLARVKELQPWFHGEYVVVLHDGTKLKLSRGQRAAVARQLGIA